MLGPSPDERYPFNGEKHTVFLKNVITRPNVVIGDYSYYHDPDHADDFENRNILYHFDFIGDNLKIGRFCALATGVQFIMNGANHALSGFSAYPFNIFGNGWEQGFDFSTISDGFRGDTCIGNDVWIGREATIMPGVVIGDGAIIGTKAVISSNVPPYAIVVGNPGRVIRRRFAAPVIDALLEIAWWNWPIDHVTRHLAAIRGGNISALQNAASAIS